MVDILDVYPAAHEDNNIGNSLVVGPNNIELMEDLNLIRAWTPLIQLIKHIQAHPRPVTMVFDGVIRL